MIRLPRKILAPKNEMEIKSRSPQTFRLGLQSDRGSDLRVRDWRAIMAYVGNIDKRNLGKKTMTIIVAFTL